VADTLEIRPVETGEDRISLGQGGILRPQLNLGHQVLRLDIAFKEFVIAADLRLEQFRRQVEPTLGFAILSQMDEVVDILPVNDGAQIDRDAGGDCSRNTGDDMVKGTFFVVGDPALVMNGFAAIERELDFLDGDFLQGIHIIDKIIAIGDGGEFVAFSGAAIEDVFDNLTLGWGIDQWLAAKQGDKRLL